MSVFTLTASQNAGTEIPPAGSHPAVLVALIDLGSHHETFMDKAKGTERAAVVHKVFLAWELTAERCSGLNRNHVIGREYMLNFSPKSKLRQLVEAWRGKKFQSDEAFDLGKVLGQPCLLTITHGTSNAGNNYAKLDSVAPVPKGFAVPPPALTPFSWQVGDEPYPSSVDTWLPFTFHKGERKPIREVIALCRELRGGDAMEPATAGAGSNGYSADEAPF